MVKEGYFFLVFIFFELFTSTMEEPIRGYTMAPPNDENFSSDPISNRHQNSRMMPLSTSLPYDEWWFMSTSRPRVIYHKDFPGRPGVATWKEITPGYTEEKRKSRKMNNPSAAEVSNATKLNFFCHPLLFQITMAILSCGFFRLRGY